MLLEYRHIKSFELQLRFHLFQFLSQYCTAPQMIPNRKWSLDHKWSQNGPQIILDCKGSPLSTPNDPLKTRGIEWILGMDIETAKNLNNV